MNEKVKYSPDVQELQNALLEMLKRVIVDPEINGEVPSQDLRKAVCATICGVMADIASNNPISLDKVDVAIGADREKSPRKNNTKDSAILEFIDSTSANILININKSGWQYLNVEGRSGTYFVNKSTFDGLYVLRELHDNPGRVGSMGPQNEPPVFNYYRLISRQMLAEKFGIKIED